MQNQKPNTTFTKKIGGATYIVQIHFSKTNNENFNDKLLRLIKNDVAQKRIAEVAPAVPKPAA
jgi:hypothetical protein